MASSARGCCLMGRRRRTPCWRKRTVPDGSCGGDDAGSSALGRARLFPCVQFASRVARGPWRGSRATTRPSPSSVSLVSCHSSSSSVLCSNLLFHGQMRKEMITRTTEKTSKGALPVGCLLYSFPRFSSMPLSMPLVSPTLAAVEGHLSTGPFHPSWCESTCWPGSLII